MNEPIRNVMFTAPRSGRKSLALCSTALFLGVALYGSRFALLPAPADDPPPKPAVAATPNAVAAANKFLAALDAQQRGRVLYDFNSPKKSAWSNLPVTFVPRNGIELGALAREQRMLAMSVVAAVLSRGGYQKVIDIMEGDQKLAEGGGGKGGKGKGKGKGGKAMFGADKYYLALFGQPSETRPWMVQFGGHHLGVNVTVIGKHFILTPTHTGAQPTRFKWNGMEVRPLGLENDTAFQLVNALDDKQRAQAIVGDRAQGDLVLGPGRDQRKVPPLEGIHGAALTAPQQALLLKLIGAWVNIVEPDAARARLAEIKANVRKTYFSWRGPTTPGSAVYFRVHGPTVWIEYAPQGGTDHIHTVVRNPTDDYGAALLKTQE